MLKLTAWLIVSTVSMSLNNLEIFPTDESYLTNGYLDTPIDWIPGMKNIRLRDLSSFVRTTKDDDLFLSTGKEVNKNLLKSKGLIINTFDFLEHQVLNALSSMFNKVYTLGPLLKFLDSGDSMSINLWEEDQDCIKWLNAQRTSSVIYVSFGSTITISNKQLIEFAWGLASSNHNFLWVLRPDLLNEDIDAILPKDFIEKTKNRCYLTSWCKQEDVLSHDSIAGFVTHCGWNSVMESISCGVPMICWPSFAEQYTNARYICNEWGIGMEIENELKREEVSKIVNELMEGEKGKELKNNALKLKEKATEATRKGGSSYQNLERLIKDIANFNANGTGNTKLLG